MSSPIEGIVTLGNLRLGPGGHQVFLEGETTSGVKSAGQGMLYEVSGPENLRLTIRDVRWENGERDVVSCERHESPVRFDTLVERLRLAVLDREGPYAELRQARLRPNGRAGLFDADRAQLARGAGLDVFDALLRLGATAVGTRAEVLGDRGRARERCGTRFEPEATLIAPAAYVLTRVAPILRELQV